MLQVQSNPNLAAKRIQGYIARIPSLSTTVTKVLNTCNTPEVSPNDLNRVISLDPVLTGQVLKLINSAYYSLRHPITSLTRAIIMLGINTVKNLVLSFAILEKMRSKASFRTFPAEEFWAHSLGVGVTAKCLSVIKGVPLTEREEYFVGGLLHDLGKIPLNQLFPDDYFQALDMAKRAQWPLAYAESAVFGIDHSQVGRMIAEKWRLSATLIESLSYHHNPDEAPEANRKFVAIVALANIFAHLLNLGSSGDTYSDNPMTGYLLDELGVEWTAVYDLHGVVFKEIEKAKIFLDISQKDPSHENKILGGAGVHPQPWRSYHKIRRKHPLC